MRSDTRNALLAITFTLSLLAAGCKATSSPGNTAPGDARAPSITAQPSNQNVTVGQRTTFTAAAGGTAPMMYQWRKNSAFISGATSPSYTTPPTTSSDNGASFQVVVSNSAGNATSNSAL